MPRATRIIAAGHRHGRPVADTVILDGAQRSAAQGRATSVKGTTIDIDLPAPVRLRSDDLLLLDDGALVEVVAAPESLIEARAADLAALARIAWHLGDRHIQAELLPNRIRVRKDAAVEALLTSLGARIATIEAPFEPEGGAYTTAPAQAHDHPHDHAHDCGCGHDHHHHAHDHGHHHD